MIDAFAMKLYREIIFSSEGPDLMFFKDNLQCILIHILVEEWSQIAMYLLTTAVYIVTELFEFVAKNGIFVSQSFYLVVPHETVYFWFIALKEKEASYREGWYECAKSSGCSHTRILYAHTIKWQ